MVPVLYAAKAAKGVALEYDDAADRVNAVFHDQGGLWPIDAAEVREAHWATCPNAATHRKDSK